MMTTHHKTLGILAFSLTLLTFTAPKEAHAGDFAFSVGNDISFLNVFGAGSASNTGTRIGYRGGKFHVFGTLDYARVGGNTILETTTNGEDRGSDEENFSASLTTVGAGTRYFFRNPDDADREAIPYLVGNVYTVFPGASVNDVDLSDEVSTLSVGFLTGFGADYFFTDQFSIGGEFGTSGFFANVSDSDTSAEFNFNTLNIYSGVQFSFYL